MTKLLIVEDDSAYAWSLLRKLGNKFKVHTVQTLAQAINAFSVGTFNAVLLDIGLPDSLPEKTVNSIKSRHPECAIVVLSGHEDPKRITQCIHDSASSYLIKGRDDLNVDTLTKAIDTAISNNEACQKAEQVKREIQKGFEI